MELRWSTRYVKSYKHVVLLCCWVHWPPFQPESIVKMITNVPSDFKILNFTLLNASFELDLVRLLKKSLAIVQFIKFIHISCYCQVKRNQIIEKKGNGRGLENRRKAQPLKISFNLFPSSIFFSVVYFSSYYASIGEQPILNSTLRANTTQRIRFRGISAIIRFNDSDNAVASGYTTSTRVSCGQVFHLWPHE